MSGFLLKRKGIVVKIELDDDTPETIAEVRSPCGALLYHPLLGMIEQLPAAQWPPMQINGHFQLENIMAKPNDVDGFLREAGTIIKGELADVNAELASGREKKKGVLWRVLTNLICYAANKVYAEGYTKKNAKQFRADVMAETNLSEKQAGKYTENISAALGVRGLRPGVRSLPGLDVAAKDGLVSVQEWLVAAEIDTFGKFMSALRVEKTPVEIAAEKLAKLTEAQRDKAMERAKELSKQDEEN